MLRKLVAALAALMLFVPVSADVTSASILKDATIHIVGAFDEGLLYKVQNELDAAKKDGATHLTIQIRSPGGSVGIGIQVINLVRESGIPTTCVVQDVAASMAAIFFESSACGERVVHANSILMFHGVSTEAKGNQREMENVVARMKAINHWAAEVVAARLGIDPDTYYQAVVVEGQEIWWVGEQCMRWHAADRVIPVPAPVVRPPKTDVKVPNCNTSPC